MAPKDMKVEGKISRLQHDDEPERDYEQMIAFYDESMRNLTEGEIVRGRVVAITANDVVVDVGYKSEGLIPQEEFAGIDGKVYVKSKEQVATGDQGVFDMKTEVMTMTGKEVVLTEGQNVIVGCKLTVQMKTGLAQVDGCGGRVIMSITPGSAKTGAQKP